MDNNRYTSVRNSRKNQGVSAATHSDGPNKEYGRRRKRKTSTITFRIEDQLKEGLQTIAAKQGRTLSSLLDRILQSFMDAHENDSPLGTIEEERREHLRRKMIIPARWKFRQKESDVEYDVIVKNISPAGACTEYINGRNLSLFRDLHASPLTLVVRMPGSPEPAELECDVKHFSITRDLVRVGLCFVNMSD